MAEQIEIDENKAWEKALSSWNNPSIPRAICPRTEEEIKNTGVLAPVIQQEYGFMKYPEFQTFMNLEKIAESFQENPQRGTEAIAVHEVGHRFCPYDTITLMIMQHRAKKALEGKSLPYSPEKASGLISNLCTDMAINTTAIRRGNQDLLWLYQEVSKDKEKSKLWRVYGKSMEIAWKTPILPEKAKLSDEEEKAATSLAGLFERDFFDRSKWPHLIQRYASIIGDFLEDEKRDGKGGGLDDITKNIPSELDEKTAVELAKRLAETGSDGMPTNPAGLKEFQEIMAGFGQGNLVNASINFYEMLSRSYDVVFDKRPFGRPRQNPFQPIKWQPSMGADQLDVDYSAALGGKLIPGVTTYTWNSRKREIHGGLEEVIPNLDLYLDSSMSMPNPVEEISLPVLAGFVVAKKALRKGARVRATNFSGQMQSSTQEWTNDSTLIYNELVKCYGGGTVFPFEKMLEDGDPKQVLVITDAFLGNSEATANAVRELRTRHKGNKIAIYALHPVDNADYLRTAGAEVIHGTTTDIFKKAIGRCQKVYSK